MGGPLHIAVSHGAACFGAVSAGSSIGDLVDGNEVGSSGGDYTSGFNSGGGGSGISFVSRDVEGGKSARSSDNSNEPVWSRITRSDGSFMGNMIWLDGSTGSQSGKNVDMFLYYSMRALQTAHSVEITAYLIYDNSTKNFGYFIEDWVSSGATFNEGGSDISEVTRADSNPSKKSYLTMNSRQYQIFALLHTHPDEGQGIFGEGSPADFDNAASWKDAVVAHEFSTPNYVLGPDWISRVTPRDNPADVESFTRPKQIDGTQKYNPSHYKVADVLQINLGGFNFFNDAIKLTPKKFLPK